MIHIVYITWIALRTLVIVLACLFVVLIYLFAAEKFQVYYNNWKTKKRTQQLEKDYEEFIRQHKLKLERELCKKEKEKYPLFYWRELTDGNS